MKKLFCLLLVFAMAIPAFAGDITVKGTAPTVTGPGAEVFNDQTQKAFDNITESLNALFSDAKYKNPNKFLEGMGDSSVYASHGATTRGYGGYKLFSASVGTIVGLKLPESITSLMNDIEGVSDTLEKDGDIMLGFSPNLLNAHVGLNMGMIKVIPEKLGILKRDDLYIGLRIGYFSLPDIFEDVSYRSFTLGLTANYQILPSISLAGFITWRGLNVGSGIIYNGATASFVAPLGEKINEPIVGDTSLTIDPKASLNFDITTVIIPLEAMTAIKLLIFNIPFGIGADIAFGSTSLDFGVASDVDYDNLPRYLNRNRKGSFSVSGGASNSPSIFNFKIMTGLGISAGPVVFDIPVTYYPASGYNIGITVGAVF